jgi:hypothetical protein
MGLAKKYTMAEALISEEKTQRADAPAKVVKRWLGSARRG